MVMPSAESFAAGNVARSFAVKQSGQRARAESAHHSIIAGQQLHFVLNVGILVSLFFDQPGEARAYGESQAQVGRLPFRYGVVPFDRAIELVKGFAAFGQRRELPAVAARLPMLGALNADAFLSHQEGSQRSVGH